METDMFAAITGMGCVCALGCHAAEVRRGLHAAERRLTSAKELAPDALDFPYFAVPDSVWDGSRSFAAGDTLKLGLLAAGEALTQAGIAPGDSAAVIAGTTSGTALHFLSGYRNFKENGHGGPDCDEYLASNPALAIRAHFGLRGVPLTISNACVSGTDAIGLALSLILSGQCERVLCGGLDALSLVPHTGFARLMIYDPAPCAPFDRKRAGLNLGEAAAFMVLDRSDVARARGQRILGKVLGYGSASDAHHFTSPHPEGKGLETAVNEALGQAGIAPEDLAFVNVHGTGTRENDRSEGRTIHRLLPDTPLWCTKGLTGHTLGAAGTIEAIFSLWALEKGSLPPSAGFDEEDPEIGVSPVHEETPINKKVALSTSLGFGGCNAALVVAVGE